MIRNLASVGIRLDRYVKNGCLRMISARTIGGSARVYLVRIKTLAEEHGARCLVIDPVSTWYKSSNDLTAQSVADRLIDWSKAEGITLVCTSLLDEMSSQSEAARRYRFRLSQTPGSTSTTWSQAGERNRLGG